MEKTGDKGTPAIDRIARKGKEASEKPDYLQDLSDRVKIPKKKEKADK